MDFRCLPFASRSRSLSSEFETDRTLNHMRVSAGGGTCGLRAAGRSGRGETQDARGGPGAPHAAEIVGAVPRVADSQRRRDPLYDADRPDAPNPQRIRALARANSVRLARAELKRRIADGETSAAEIILDCPGEVQRLTVAELLLSQRRWGETRCRRFLEGVEISELKLIGDLTERQRRLLAAALEAQQARSATPSRQRACSTDAPASSTRARELTYV